MSNEVVRIKSKAPSSVLFWHTSVLWGIGLLVGFFLGFATVPLWAGILLLVACIGFLYSVDRWIDKSILSWTEDLVTRAFKELDVKIKS